MTPKEKAEELVKTFYDKLRIDDSLGDIISVTINKRRYDESKQCALICVDETIEALNKIPDLKVSGNVLLNEIENWRSIKQEIQKL